MKLEKSFISMTLLIMLANASPRTEKIETKRNIKKTTILDKSNKLLEKVNKRKGVKTKADKNPSKVLLGLTLLIKGLFP